MAESGSLSLVQGEEPNKVNTVPALWLAPVSPSRVTAYLVTLACAFYTFLVQITSWGAASYFLTGQNGSYRGYLYAPMSLSPLTVLNQSLSLSHQEGQLGCRQSCLWSPAASLGQCGPAWRRGPPALLAPALLLPSALLLRGSVKAAALTSGIHAKDLSQT